ncbi:hypothetical protein GGI35DRAFT_174790 [Trichoderma velutinum]
MAFLPLWHLAKHHHVVLYLLLSHSLIDTLDTLSGCPSYLSISLPNSSPLIILHPLPRFEDTPSRSTIAGDPVLPPGPGRRGIGLDTLHTLHTVCLCFSCIIAVVPCSGPRPVAAAPISIPSHGAPFHLCAQPIRVPSQGVPPSQRRAAAAIVAKSPFQRARPVFETLMRKRAASAYACIANPRVPPAPGATNYHRAFPVYPASHRPQM